MIPYKLKIKLENSNPGVERKVLVPQDINLLQLHLVIQEAMGWEHAHFFEFSDYKGRKTSWRAGIPSEFDDFGMVPVKPVDDVRLEDIEQSGLVHFFYWYDFGDDWWHKISFQKPTKKDLSLYKGIPLCVEAINACPPEDVGGVWGYESFLEVILDPKHPEHQQYREWIGLEPGETYNYLDVDIELTNDLLKQLFASEDWSMGVGDFFEED